jgi:hypothetical protein
MRLWEDGFDHYGSASHMTDNSYATVGSNVSISTAHPATGTSGVYINGQNDTSNSQCLRWVLPTSKTKMGAAGRFYFDNLPAGNIGANIFDFLSGDSRKPQVTCLIDSNGALRFLRGRNYFTINGENGTLIAQSDPVVTGGANNHIEVQVFIDSSAGWVRAAVNGVHRFEATGLNTQFDTSGICSIAQSQGISGGTGSGPFYMDDYYLYDFTGNSAVDTDFCPTVDGTGKATNYIGELQVWPLFPNGDTAQADWAKSSGTVGYSLINEASPDDSGYIYSTAAGNLSEFDLDDLPTQITYIRGLGIHARMSKSDAGAAQLKLGMKSVAATSDASARPITTIPSYWVDQINVDPNSSSNWTRTSLNAAKLRLTRSV